MRNAACLRMIEMVNHDKSSVIKMVKHMAITPPAPLVLK